MAAADKLSDTRSLLQAAFDVSDQAITVTGTVTTTPAVGAATEAKQDTQITHLNAIETAVESLDAKVTAVNTGAVVVSSSALPTGAATAAKQPALGTAGTASVDVITIQGIASMTALVVDGSGVTQPVSAASLPLPTGASTAANQSTANTSLASIDGKITAVNTGAVVISSSALPTGAATSAAQTTGNNSLASIDGKMAALGQAAMAASMPVVIASNQSAVSVTTNALNVVDLLDNGIIQGSTINGSGGAFKEVVASTAATVKKIQIFDTTGDFLGWYTGAAASEALLFISGPGTNETLEVAIPSGTRLSVKGLEASSSGAGAIAANLLG